MKPLKLTAEHVHLATAAALSEKPLPASLEALTVVEPGEALLQSFCRMPALRKLILVGSPRGCCWVAPETLQEVGFHAHVPSLDFLRDARGLRHLAVHPPGWADLAVPPRPPARLQWLSVALPSSIVCDRDAAASRPGLLAMLKAFQATLRNLRVVCEVTARDEETLVSLLRQCDFGQTLDCLVLFHQCPVDEDHMPFGRCASQVLAVRAALARPRVEVVCSTCAGQDFRDRLDIDKVWETWW